MTALFLVTAAAAALHSPVLVILESPVQFIIVGDIRLIIQQQCGVGRVLVDELTVGAGGTGSVTIGCLDPADFDKVLRVLDGARLDNFTLSAEPYRPNQDNEAPTSNRDLPNNGFELGPPSPPQRVGNIPPWQRGTQNQMPNANVFGFGASSQAVNPGNVPPWQEERPDIYEPRFQRTTMELHQPDYRDRSPLSSRDLRRSVSPPREKRGRRSAREPPPPPPFRQRPDLGRRPDPGRRPGERPRLPGSLKRNRSSSPIDPPPFGHHKEAMFTRRDPFPQVELARLHQPFEMHHAPTPPFGSCNAFGTSRMDLRPLMGSPPRLLSEPHSIWEPRLGTLRRPPFSGLAPPARIRRAPVSGSAPPAKKRSVPHTIQSQQPTKASTKKGRQAVVNNPSIVGYRDLPSLKLGSWIPLILYEMIGSKPIIKCGIKEKYKSLMSACEEALLVRVREIAATSKPADAKHLVELYRAKFPASGDRDFLLAVSDQLGLPIPTTVDEMLSESPWSEPLKVADKVFDEARSHAAAMVATRLLKPGAAGKSEILIEDKKLYRPLRALIGSRIGELAVDPGTEMIKADDLLKLYQCGRTARSDRELIDLAIAEHNLKNPTIKYKGQFNREVRETSSQIEDTSTQVGDTSSQNASMIHAAAIITTKIISPNATGKNNLEPEEKKIYKYVKTQVDQRLPEILSEHGLTLTTKNIPEAVALYHSKCTDGDELIRKAIAKHDAEHPTDSYNGVHKKEEKPAQCTEEQTRDAVALQKRTNAAAVITLRLLQPGAKGKSDLEAEEKKIYAKVRDLLVERLADVEVVGVADPSAVKVMEVVKAYRRKYNGKSDRALLGRAISEYNTTTKEHYKGAHVKCIPPVSASEDIAPAEVELVHYQAPTQKKDPTVKANLQMLIRKDYAASIIASEVFELNQSHFFKPNELSAMEKKNALTWISEIIGARLSEFDTKEMEALTSTSAMVNKYRDHYPSHTDRDVLATVARDLLCPQYTARPALDNSMDDDVVVEAVTAPGGSTVVEGGVISDDDTEPEGGTVPGGSAVTDGEPVPDGNQVSGDNQLPEECGKPVDPLLVKKWINMASQELSLKMMGFQCHIGEALVSMTLKQKRITSRLRDKLRSRMITVMKLSPDKPRAKKDLMKIYRSVYDDNKDRGLLEVVTEIVEKQEVVQLTEPTPFELALWIKKIVAPLAHRLLYTPERATYENRERKAALLFKVKAALYAKCAEVVSNAPKKPQDVLEVKELYESTYSESDTQKMVDNVEQEFIEEMRANVEAIKIARIQDNAQFAEDVPVDNLISEPQIPVVGAVQSEEPPEPVVNNVESTNGTALHNLTIEAQPEPLQPEFKKRQRLRYRPRRATQRPSPEHAADISIDDIQINMDDLEDY